MSVALALGVSACSGVPADLGNETSGVGTVALPLTAESGDTLYRLAQARFTIKGSGLSRVIQPPADLPVHQETLPVGGYEIFLEKGWRLEKKGPEDGSFVEVPAELSVRNPLKFSVKRNATVDVVFTFTTNGGKVDLTRGRTNVRIDVQDCGAYDTYAASIATSVVECLGAIGPTDFVVTDEGFIKRNFERCQNPDTEKQLLADIDGFVGLQYPRELPAAIAGRLAFSRDCIAGRWAVFQEAFQDSGIVECPVWQKESEINTPTPETYKEFGAQLPTLPFAERGQRPAVVDQLKISNLWVVRFPNGMPDQQCATPGDCAARCAAGFPGFVIRQDGETVLTDPPPWQRATVYGGTSPFDAPYYHPMSLYGALPGETVAHINRANQHDEFCSFYDGEFHVQTLLKENCAVMPDGTQSCIGLCVP